ncbi:MAG: T9SS type A sorting domain-containing protein [Bacteroidetes bacterium]|nr:T9SS type A sorting domain-containing protein [Bacteroidota bacterium]
MTNTSSATISGGASMVVQAGGTLTNSGTITNNGTLTISSGATLANTGTIEGTGTSSLPALTVSSNISLPNGATYSSISIINGVTLTAEGDLKTDTLSLGSGTISLKSGTLSISSNITGSSSVNTISSDGKSSLNLTANANGTLYFDQTNSGTTNSFINLTLNTSGTITLGNAIRISGVYTSSSGILNTSDNLTLISSSPGSYGQIAPGNGTITGNITMEMTASGTGAGWRPIALPLVSTLANLSGINQVYSGHTPANEINTYYWNPAQNGTTGLCNGWTAASSTDDNTRPYIIYANNNSNGLHDFSGKLSVSGTNSTGNKTFNLFAYTDPDTSSGITMATGWNFIPNPYPCNLSISALLSTRNTNFTPSYKAIHVYNYASQQYEVYSSSGVSIVNYHNTESGNTISNIPPFAGFWVKSSSNQTLTITNAERTTSTSNVATLLKNNYDLLRLNVSDANGMKDQCVVYFTADATQGFDNIGDAYKLDGLGAAPSLSSLIGGARLSINALPSSLNEVSIPLSYKSNTKGKAEISLDFSELDAAWNVLLEDKLTGIKMDLKNGAYSFENNGTNNLRFILHLEKKGATGIGISGEAGFELYQDFNTVYINLVEKEPVYISIYTLSGKLMAQYELENPGHQTIPNQMIQEPGVYIVEARSTGFRKTLKVIK